MLRKSTNFNLSVLITKQNKRFVAYSPALDISTSGKSAKEAKNRFVELANLFLEEILEEKIFDEVLLELGWTKVQKKWNPPQLISTKSVGIKSPLFA